MKFFPKYTVLIATSLFLASTAFANLIVNGNFEDGADQSPVIPNWITTPQVQTNTSADYRTYAGGIGDTGTGQMAAFGGGQLPGGTLSQSFSTISGQSYVLSFLYGSFGPPSATQSLGLDLSVGAFATTVTTAGSSQDLSGLLLPYSFTFQANNSMTTLTFSDLSGTSINVDGLLDNVSVVAAPGVPDSGSTFALLALVLIGLLVVPRRSGHAPVLA